ncbi:MAG: HAD-IA family hydrolase [Nitrospiraceae bacterium]
MSAIKVVFFDAAGTLFHVKGSVADVYLSYAEPFGIRRTPELLASVNEAFKRAFHDAPPPLFAASDPVELKQCERLWWFDIVHNVFYRVGMFEGFDEYFDRVYEAFADPQHWALYPETQATLESLKRQGFELGIISNFDTRLFSVLKGLGLTEWFDTVTISSWARAAKPAPKIFRLAHDKHAVDAEEAVHVGDSLKDDWEGARAANVAGLLLDRAGAHPGKPTIKGLEEVSERIALLSQD